MTFSEALQQVMAAAPGLRFPAEFSVPIEVAAAPDCRKLMVRFGVSHELMASAPALLPVVSMHLRRYGADTSMVTGVGLGWLVDPDDEFYPPELILRLLARVPADIAKANGAPA